MCSELGNSENLIKQVSKNNVLAQKSQEQRVLESSMKQSFDDGAVSLLFRVFFSLNNDYSAVVGFQSLILC